jgi:hypothetical protein
MALAVADAGNKPRLARIIKGKKRNNCFGKKSCIDSTKYLINNRTVDTYTLDCNQTVSVTDE